MVSRGRGRQMLHRGCGKSLVGGLMIWTDFAVGIVLRSVLLLGGPSYCCAFLMHALGVNMGWLGCKRSSIGQLLRHVCP